MLPILQIGPLALPAPTLILMIGLLAGLELAEKQAERFGVKADHIYSVTLAAVIAGLIGARLAYVAQYPTAFLENPLELLSPRPQMLNATGGYVLALAAALVYLWSRKLAFWPTIDAATSLFAVMAIGFGLSHLASGDAFGAPAQVPWAISLWGEMRHPSQIYETLAALVITALVWPGGSISIHTLQRPGLRFWAFMALCAGSRVVLETYRGDSTILWNSFREAQVIAWVALAFSLWQIGRRIAPSNAEDLPAGKLEQ